MLEQDPRERPRDLRIWIRGLTPVLIAALGVGAIVQYRRAGREVESRFDERQTFVARQAADRLSAVFDEARKLLALLQHLQPSTDDAGLAILARVVGELGEPGAVHAWRVDRDGNPLLSTQKPGGALEQLWRGLPRCPRLLEPPRSEPRIAGIALPRLCVSGPIHSSLSRSGWVLVAAIGMPEGGGGSGGDLALVLDWGELRRMVERITNLSPATHAWMIDTSGRLILHPNHRDSQTDDAFARGLGCASCHPPLGDLHLRMRRGESGNARVRLQDGDPRLFAFGPVRVGHQGWSLAVVTPAHRATAAEHRGLAMILIFSGGIMLVMLVGAVLLDREASRRVRVASAFNRELADKVAERTEEIAGLYARLSAVQAHHTRLERVAVAGEMASIVAHEIRTPLNALSINAQMISRKLRRDGEGDREGAVELLGTLEREIARINDLLEEHVLALVRHRGLDLRPLSLNEAVEEAIRFIEPEAARQLVRIEPALGSELPIVQADPAKLRQVLLNVLLNAIQAVPQGGRVRVATRGGAGVASVLISDSGPGIASLAGGAEEDVEQVFKPFVTSKPDGTGLGLAICVRLVKELKGRFRVCASPELGGACFAVELPVELGEEPVDQEE